MKETVTMKMCNRCGTITKHEKREEIGDDWVETITICQVCGEFNHDIEPNEPRYEAEP